MYTCISSLTYAYKSHESQPIARLEASLCPQEVKLDMLVFLVSFNASLLVLSLAALPGSPLELTLGVVVPKRLPLYV